jgi:hypothetical protein
MFFFLCASNALRYVLFPRWQGVQHHFLRTKKDGSSLSCLMSRLTWSFTSCTTRTKHPA